MNRSGRFLYVFLRNATMIIILLLTAGYAVTGFVVLPPMVKHTLQAVFAEQTGRALQVDKVSINPFALSASVEGLSLPDEKEETMFGFKRFFVDLRALSLLRSEICIDDMVLENPKFIVMRDAKGKFNFFDLLENSAMGQHNDASSPEPTVDIRRMDIKNGQLTLMDQAVSPMVRIKFSQIDVMVRRSGSVPNHQSHLEIRGKIDDHTPFTVSGDVDLLSPKSFTAVAMTAQDIDMSRLTPYASGFMGRPIEKGQMDLDLFCRIEGNILNIVPHLVLAEFTLGDVLESPGAPPLPWNMAISLLTDRKGEIHVDLPMEGDIDNPEFRFSPMVRHAVTRFITKTTTSPFTHLKGVIDTLEDLQTIHFSPGTDDLSPKMQERVTALANALDERPMLNLEIKGTFDPETDEIALPKTTDWTDAALQILGRNRADHIRNLLIEKGLDANRIFMTGVMAQEVVGEGNISAILALKAN